MEEKSAAFFILALNEGESSVSRYGRFSLSIYISVYLYTCILNDKKIISGFDRRTFRKTVITVIQTTTFSTPREV
jgi:hypothetical protein